MRSIFFFILVIQFFSFFGCNKKQQKSGFVYPDELNPSKTFAKNEIPIDNPNVLIELLNDNGNIECSGVGGIASKPSISYSIFEKLCKVASDTALVRFSNYSNPKVRVYSMWALIKKNKVMALKQLQKLKNDSRIIEYDCGCSTLPTRINSLIASRFDSTNVIIYEDFSSGTIPGEVSIVIK